MSEKLFRIRSNQTLSKSNSLAPICSVSLSSKAHISKPPFGTGISICASKVSLACINHNLVTRYWVIAILCNSTNFLGAHLIVISQVAKPGILSIWTTFLLNYFALCESNRSAPVSKKRCQDVPSKDIRHLVADIQWLLVFIFRLHLLPLIDSMAEDLIAEVGTLWRKDGVNEALVEWLHLLVRFHDELPDFGGLFSDT